MNNRRGSSSKFVRSGRRSREPDLTSLINIVFLILIFFIVAGSLRPFSAHDLKLAKVTEDATTLSAPVTLIVHADGQIRYRGKQIALEEIHSLSPAHNRDRPATIVVDGRLTGSKLLEVSRALRAAGYANVSILVERASQ